MSLQKAVANALSFAHLGGIGRGKASKAEEEDEKKEAKAESDDEKPEDEDEKPASAEDDGEDAKAEDDKPEEKDDEKESSKAKGSAAEEDDEDKDEEMRGSSAAAKARGREQRRCAAIFASPAAARNPVLAANLAFKTRMTRSEAIATLEATPAPAAANHLGRAARNPNVGAGGAAKPTPQQAAAARWDQNLQAAAKSGRR